MFKAVYQAVVPEGLRRTLNCWANDCIRRFKAPRMVTGYRNSSGVWQGKTRISDTVFLNRPENISIADNVFVWHYTILDGTGGIEIGEGTQIGAWVGIFTHSSHIAIRLYGKRYTDIPEDQKKGFTVSPVRIGRYVFIGAGSTLLPGVTVGDGVLISAGSVVTKKVNNFEIVSGNPAQVVGDTRTLDQTYLRDSQIKEWYDEWQHAREE